jgi:hypothetical protein
MIFICQVAPTANEAKLQTTGPIFAAMIEHDPPPLNTVALVNFSPDADGLSVGNVSVTTSDVAGSGPAFVTLIRYSI